MIIPLLDAIAIQGKTITVDAFDLFMILIYLYTLISEG